MAWRGLTKQLWEAIRIHLPEPKGSPQVDARASRIGAVLRAASGSCGSAPNGANCPAGMAVPIPAGGGSNTCHTICVVQGAPVSRGNTPAPTRSKKKKGAILAPAMVVEKSSRVSNE